jgi:hypothetical protein
MLKTKQINGNHHSEIENMINNGPKAEDLQKVKENMLKKYEEDLQEKNGGKTQ